MTLSSAATGADDELISSRFARDTLLVTICILLSRMTGFVRVLVAAAVLGNGLLGDTYHAANTIPNLLFELFAGGAGATRSSVARRERSSRRSCSSSQRSRSSVSRSLRFLRVCSPTARPIRRSRRTSST